MNELLEIINRCRGKLSKLKDESEVLKEVERLLSTAKTLDINKSTKEELLELAYSLRMASVQVGEMYAEAGLYDRSSYFYNKLNGARVFLDLPDGTLDTKRAKVTVQTKDSYEDNLYYAYRAKVLEVMYKDLDSIIGLIQTALKHR